MTILDRAVNIVDFGTSIPGRISKFGDDLNDKVIKVARDLDAAKGAAADKAESNLVGSKINSLGRDAATWLQSGNNGWIAGAVIITIVILIRKF